MLSECWDLKLSVLEEWPVLLTAEPSLQFLNLLIVFRCVLSDIPY